MEDSKKSGFTLIELLAVIVVLVLIFSITFFFSGNIFGGVADKVDKTTKKMILDATNEYVLEYRNKEWWKEDINDSGDITFCVSLESLLETGYYDSDDKYVLENKDKLLVSAVIDSKKVIKYDLIDYNDAKDKCNYSFNESLLDKDNGKIDIMDDNNENSIGSLEYNVDKIDNNNYDVNINFLAELGIKNIEVDAPVYVAIILDNSGSMIGDSWNNAKKAAINLSEKVINELDDSYIALIQYSDSPLLVRNFEKKALSNSSFIAPYGGTNVSGSLDLTASLYKELDVPDYAMLYAILLYDGLPTYYSYLYNTSNKKNLYNSSTTLYYDNFLTAYYGANNSYNYLYNPNPNISGFEPSVYINNASNYLKSNNSNLRLITIGYNFDESSSNSNDLKEISSIDNNFCANSDYKVDTTVEKETELNSINNVDMKTHQITYPFVYNKTNGSLSSSNVGIMTESYGYYELDLTEYSENDEIELFIDYTLINPQDRDYLLVIISDFEERNASKFTASGCYVSKWSDYENYYSYCDYSSGTTKKNIMGGKKYYVHVYYEHNGAANYYHTDFEKKGAVVINKFSYSLVKNELIYDSSVSGYNSEDLINLSSVSESQLVYDPVIKDDKLILSGLTSNSISGAYEKIDLSNKEGTYLLTINAASNNDMGIIYISNSPVAVFPPAKYKAFGSITDFNFDNYAIENVCQAENSRCIFQKTPANDYHFKLDGGKIYYVHFVNQTNFWGNYKEGVANFIINEISLLKVGNEISNVDMNTISDDMCLDDSLNYVSCLKDSDTYEFKFIQNNGSIISTNKEIKDSCSHSYVELDLTEYGSNELVVVSFNSTSSSSPYASSLKSLDLSNIIITETKDAPNLNKMACDIRNDNDCVLIAISGSRNSYARLSGGKKYYVHFMYCKNTTGSYNDYFSIKLC